MERYACAPRYNIARGQTAPVIVDGETRMMRWGLLAAWRGHGGKRGPMIYETPEDAIASTPQLRKATRVLVPADGFYAWRAKLVPYFIHGAGRAYFAALVDTRDDHVESFAFITVPAGALVAPFAATMPLVEGGLAGWRADAISARVNDLAHDDAGCVTPLAQQGLF